MDNIAMAKFSASENDSDTTKNKNRFKKNKEHKNSGKKCCNNSLLYCSLHEENNGRTSRDFKVLKARASEKYKSKYGKKDYKKRFKKLNLLQAEAVHQISKYKKLNKAFTKRNTSEEENFNISDSSDSNSSSIS